MANTKQTAITTRIVWFLVLLFLIITVVSQLVIHFYNPLVTEAAELYSTSSYVQLTGVYVRNEKLVTYDGGGVVSYVHSDGEKLAKSSVIAEIYGSISDLGIQQEINALQNQISLLEDAESLVGSDNSQLEAFSSQIYEKHSQLLQYLSQGDFSSAALMKDDYLNLQSKRMIVKGAETDYNEKIAELSAQIAVLEAKIAQAPQSLTIDETGYFISTVDGYEQELSYDTIDALTEEQIDNIVKNPTKETADNAIGKIISDYKWKMAFVIDTEKAGSIFESATLRLRIGSSSNIINATVESMKKNDTGNTVIILSCDIMNSDLINGRTVQFKLLFDDYDGIRIPSSAVRFDEDGNEGVYTKLGVEIIFKKIKSIVYEDKYVIVEDTTGESGYLALYDTVVVEGTDLYDGKIVLQ